MSVTSPSAPMKSPCSSCRGFDDIKVQTERPDWWRNRRGCTSEMPCRCRSIMRLASGHISSSMNSRGERPSMPSTVYPSMAAICALTNVVRPSASSSQMPSRVPSTIRR